MLQNRSIAKGFTLVEIMIVIVVVGIIAAIAIPLYSDYVTRARVTEAIEFADAARTKVVLAQMEGQGIAKAPLDLLDGAKRIDMMTGLEWRPVSGTKSSGDPVVGFILPTMDLPGFGIKHPFVLELTAAGAWHCVSAGKETGIKPEDVLEAKYLPASCQDGAPALTPPPNAPQGCPAGTRKVQTADVKGVMHDTCEAIPAPAPAPAASPAACPPNKESWKAASGDQLCIDKCTNGGVHDTLMQCCPASSLINAGLNGAAVCNPLAPAPAAPATAAPASASPAPSAPAPTLVCKDTEELVTTVAGKPQVCKTKCTSFEQRQTAAPFDCASRTIPPQTRQPTAQNNPCGSDGVWVPAKESLSANTLQARYGVDAVTDAHVVWDGSPKNGYCMVKGQAGQDPYGTVQCQMCTGPVQICEQVHITKACVYPNNFCINYVHNHLDGTRTVVRGCGNFDTTYREWYLGTSDEDKCDNMNKRNVHVDFQCTFACSKDKCNTPVRPEEDSLYKPAMTSDIRLKKDIVRVGTRPDGLGVYEYEYVWGGGRQIGLMAQEVQRLYPEAVVEIGGGFLGVYYDRVPRMETE